MAKGSTIRSFLNQRQNSLRKTIHVRRLLLSHNLRGVFTDDERTQIEKERSETTKCELFLSIVLSKDDNVVEKFMSALQRTQPDLDVLQEWRHLCTVGSEVNDQLLKHSRVPTESEDHSIIEEKMLYSDGSLTNNLNDVKTGNDFNYSKPGPLTSEELTHKNIGDDSGACGLDSSSIATKILHHLSYYVELSLQDKSEFQSKINQVMSEKDVLLDTNQRLMDILVALVRQQRLSPYVVERALKDMNMGEVARNLIKETVHDKYLHELPVEPWTRLVQELSVNTCSLQGNNCARLVEILGLTDKINPSFLDQRYKCPAEEVLNIWKQKRNATVSNLYNILVKMDATTAAAILEPYLPIVPEVSEEKVMDKSLSMCSSISDNELVDKSLNL